MAHKPVTAWQLEKSVGVWQRLQQQFSVDTTSLSNDENVVGTAVDLPDSLSLPDGGHVPNPHILLARLIDDAVWADRRVEEADNLRKRYTSRRDRYAERSDAIRAHISALAEILDVSSAEGELGAFDFAKGRSSVVADVDRLPEQYIREKIIREADKIELAKALKALKPGETIEGAELSNPGWVLRITPF
jgi:hypothetical protein